MNLGISIQELALYGLVIAITCLAIFIFTMIMHHIKISKWYVRKFSKKCLHDCECEICSESKSVIKHEHWF
jgi:hypothetical protein